MASIRTASTEHLDVRSPIPDSGPLPEGFVCRNVERLEQSAEELSQGGSDIGEEIRKLQEEQRRTDSRRSSLASRTSPTTANPPSQQPLHTIATNTRSRGASASSYSNSILDLNREARWGGYSPGGFINSPAASIHSGSWPQPTVLHRTASNTMSISTRPEPVQEGRPLDSPLTSPTTFTRQTSHASFDGTNSIQNSIPLSRKSSRASEPSSLRSDTMEHHPEMPPDSEVNNPVENVEEVEHNPVHVQSDPAVVHQDAGLQPAPSHEPERPGSSETFRQANLLFEDFDGVHFSPANEEFIATDDQGNVIGRIPLDEANEALIQQGLLSQPERQRVSFAPPPPPDNMVYYPAPVPRILNLPKKLSSRPSSNMIGQRHSQAMLYAPRSDTRNTLRMSVMDFDDQPELQPDHDLIEEDEDALDSFQHTSTSPARRPNMQQRSSMASLNRMSNLPPQFQQRASMATLNRMSNMPTHVRQSASMASLNRISNVPPQLRASLFFDHPAERQSVNIQSDSAVATLESILQASATAPVSVFTDHPFAGRAGADVYAKEHPRPKRNAMSKPLVADAKNTDETQRARRKSASTVLDSAIEGETESRLPRRNSVMSLLTDLGNPEGKKLRKRNSRLSLGSQDLLNDDAAARAESPAPSAILNHAEHNEDHTAQYDEDEEDEELQDPDVGPVYAQPTTLLAELQLRKAQQKSRNRTAANAFPNGMHATLLELDAVAQIESRKRKNHKVALAWEEPSAQTEQDDEVDEDTPLAVLYPTKNGLGRRNQGDGDWDRPIGLIEKRQLEDNEPLARRRNRLLGINPRAASRLNLSAEPSPTGLSNAGEDPDEDIPLAERKRRMQQKAKLDSALDGVSRDSKSTFEADVLSVMGVPAPVEAAKEAEKENGEETLGQRRARLQRENSSLTLPAGGVGVERPALRQSMSLANLLGSVPMDPNRNRADRRNVTSPAANSLLGQHESQSMQHKAQLREHNARRTSYQHAVPSSGLQSAEIQAPEYQLPGQVNSQGQVNGLISSAGGGVGNRRTSSYLGPLQSSVSVPGSHALNLQSKIQAGLAQQGQMMNPLAFSNFVPPAPVTGLGFNGGMAAAPGYGMMPGQPMGGMQQSASMPFGFMNGAAQNPLMGYGNGAMGMGMNNMNMNMNMNPAMGYGMGMGMGMGYGYGYNPMAMNQGMAGGYGMMQNDGLNPAKRDTIDQWRSGVAP